MPRMGCAAAVATAWLLVATPTVAQRPQLGVGITGGMVLGSELLHHVGPLAFGGDEHSIDQRILLTELAASSLQAEWYVARHVALRAHAARGTGRLAAVTLLDGREGAGISELESGFGPVGVRALDVGIGVWPFAPRTEGFAPFLSLGAGTIRYVFRGRPDAGSYFVGQGVRRQSVLVFGAGADMNIWTSVMLRFEAMSHRTASPLEPEDFPRLAGSYAPISERLGRPVHNVRLVLGAVVYLPFVASSSRP